jgi:hypothetical protein
MQSQYPVPVDVLMGTKAIPQSSAANIIHDPRLVQGWMELLEMNRPAGAKRARAAPI